MRNTLIITDQSVSCPVDASYAYEYRIDGGQVQDDGTMLINDADRLNRLGSDLAQRYTDSIAELRCNMPWQALRDDILGLLFYFTEVSTKRTEINESYDAFINAVFLRQTLPQGEITTIYVYGAHFLKNDTLGALFPDAAIIRDHLPSPTPKMLTILGKNLYYFLRFLLTAICRWHSPKPTEKLLRAKRFFMTRYPGRLSDDGIEDKYSNLVGDDDCYIAGVLTDGMQQNMSFGQWWKSMHHAKRLRQTIFYDRFHHVSDGLAGLFWMIAIVANVSKSKTHLRIDGIELSQIINEEIRYSLFRLPRMITVSRSIKRVYEKITMQGSSRRSIVYYLHEYGYGRMYTALLARFFPNLRRIAIQHGPASVRKMVYWVSHREWTDSAHPLPKPHAVLAEDTPSAALYRYVGYDHVMTMAKAPRLRGVFSTSVTPAYETSQLPYLVATGLHDSDVIMAMMRPIMAYDEGREYLVKFHPKASISDDLRALLPDNCRIVQEPITVLFEQVGKVYVTYSSVGQEAEDIGLEVHYLDIPGRVSERPNSLR